MSQFIALSFVFFLFFVFFCVAHPRVMTLVTPQLLLIHLKAKQKVHVTQCFLKIEMVDPIRLDQE